MKADVVFVVDFSGSIGFQFIIQFIKDTVQMFPVGSHDNLVGIILFSTNARLYFNEQTHTYHAALLTALNNLHYYGGPTNTAAALDLLLSAQDGSMGLRPGRYGKI